MRRAFWCGGTLTGVAAIALIATAMPALAAQVPESPDPIKIAKFDWTSADLNTKIMAGSSSVGYKVEI